MFSQRKSVRLGEGGVTNRKDDEYMWIVESPLGDQVALKRHTYESHIGIDHADDASRMIVYPYVKSIISDPRFIIRDVDYETNQRVKYIDLVADEALESLKSVVVVVETNRTPHEVVTWMAKSKLQQEKFKGGGIIYDSRAHQRGSSSL